MSRLLSLLVLLCALGVGAYALSDAREYQLFGTVVARVETDQPLVALTFDDGPVPGHTEQVLGILAGRGVRATFFVTGREADANPDALRALIAAGHEIGNHAFSHERMILVRPDWVEDELARTDTAIRAAGYEGPIHFRPPYGTRLVVLPWVLEQQARTTIMWDAAPDSDPNAGPERIARGAVETAEPGSIILLHAMYDSREATRTALPRIIDGLHARGFRLVTVSDLMAAGDIAPDPAAQ